MNLTHAALEDVERGVGGLPEEFLDAVGEPHDGQEAAPENAVEIELARFSECELERARETLLRRAREAGLPPREMQLCEFFVRNPSATYRDAADHLRVSVGTVKKLKNRIKNTLGAA